MSADDMRDVLLASAKSILVNSYSPYSRFAVGAALLTDDGTIITGKLIG
jgi:cytidine deaminase